MSTGWAAVIVAIAVLTVTNTALLVGLLRRHEAVLSKAEAAARSSRSGDVLMGLEPGETIEPFRAKDGSGRVVTDKELLARAPSVVVILEPGCAACEQMMPALASGQVPMDGLPLTVVLPETAESHHRKIDNHAWTIYQHDFDVSGAFGAQISPVAFVVGKDGLILAREVPGGVDDLRRLMKATSSTNGITPATADAR